MAVYYLVLGLMNDQKAGAVVGKFRVINAAKTLLTKFINIETICFQWMAQGGRWKWFKIATIPGTNFAIRRSIIEQLGGWDDKALAEIPSLRSGLQPRLPHPLLSGGRHLGNRSRKRGKSGGVSGQGGLAATSMSS